MARYTEAYSSFTVRLDEVNLLTRRARSLERMTPIVSSSEIRATCRGSIVLLCSHIEGYVKDIGDVVLDKIHSKKVDRASLVPRFFYSISKEHFDLLVDARDPDQLAEKMFDFLATDIDLWGKSGPFPSPVPADRFMKGFASPSVGKIAKFLGRFGYADYKRDLARKLKSDYAATINMIDNIVSIRNNIAHGNAVETRTPGEITQMLELSRLFCRTTDDVLCDWAKDSLCGLR